MIRESDINNPIGYFESFLKTDFKGDFEKYKKKIMGISGFDSVKETIETTINGEKVIVPILKIYLKSIYEEKIKPEIEKTNEILQQLYIVDRNDKDWSFTNFINNKIVKKLDKLITEYGSEYHDFGISNMLYNQFIGYIIEEMPEISDRLKLIQSEQVFYPKNFEDTFNKIFEFTKLNKYRSDEFILDDKKYMDLQNAFFEFYKFGSTSVEVKMKFYGISKNMLNNLFYIFNKENPYKSVEHGDLFDFLVKLIVNYEPANKKKFVQSMRVPFKRERHSYIPDSVIKIFRRHGLLKP
ncbi:MAG: hypothetical protein ACK58Q_06840 [Chitinophagales bacterium]